MKHIIRKILKESFNGKQISLIISLLKKSDPPYVRKLKSMGFDYDEILEILKIFFNTDSIINNGNTLFVFEKNSIGSTRIIYYEALTNNSTENKLWSILQYDEKDRLVYQNDSSGEWQKMVYSGDNRTPTHIIDRFGTYTT